MVGFVTVNGEWGRGERGGGGCGSRGCVRGVCCGRGTSSIVIVIAGGNATDRKQRMRTASPLIDAAVAEAPFSVVALVAFPVTVVGQRLAYIAEYAVFQSLGRIVARRLPPLVIDRSMGGLRGFSIFVGA